MAYSEDVNINMNLMAGAMGGVTAIMGGMSALTSTFSQFGTEAANTFGTLDGLLVGTTALIASFGMKAAEAYGEFEQGMKIVQTVSNQSGAAITELTNKANEMSVAYRTSIGDITDGLQTLGRAGLNSATTQLEVLESGLQTAKLEGRNLNGVLEEIIQNTAMLGGDLKSTDFGKQSEYLNSLMVGTSMTAPIDSHDISQTLQYAGGTAAAAGANLENKDKLEDLMGTVAAFAQKGVKGSMAGTALRAFFTKPASQDNSVTEGLAMIGLSPEALWENGGQSMKKVSDQIAIIRNQMNALHLSTMDQVEIWGKIVGPKMGQQMMKLQANDIKDLTRDIQSSQSTEALAAQTLQTYNQKVSEMQQQGEVAFRELGSKAVMFLTPIVDVISKILGLLSNKWVNTTVFAALGSLVSFGIRRIWGMLNTVFRQVKGLLTDVARGVQTINSLSGGSAQGFQNSAAQVEYLNVALHETDATLQDIQARSLGAKLGYMIPGGLASDKIPRDALKIYEEDVIRDYGGVMGGDEGQIYSGEKADQYKVQTQEKVKKLEEELEDRRIETENKISEIRKRQDQMTKIADDEHLARVEKIREKYNLNKDSIRSMADVQRAMNPDYTAQVDAWEKEELAKERSRKNELLAESATRRRSQLSDFLPGMEETISELEEELNVFKEETGKKIEKFKRFGEEGITQVQTRLELTSIKEAEDWYYDLLAKEAMGEATAEEIYSRMRTEEVWNKLENQGVLEHYEKQGYTPIYKSKPIADLNPDDKLLAQIYSSGLGDEMIQAKKARIDNAVDVLSGNQTFSAKAAKITEGDFNALGKGAKAASDGLSKFRSGIESITGSIRRIAHPDYLQQNATTLQSSALDKLKSKELDLGGKTFSAAMQELSSSVGLTAKEFAVLNQSTEVLRATQLFDDETLKQLGTTAAEIKQQFIEQLASMEREGVERQKLIAALEIEYDQIMGQVGKDGIGAIGGEVGGVKGKLKGVKGALSSAIGYLGGPVMAAMMGFTFGMQVIQEVQQKWQEKMQEAESAFSEASDRLSTAKDNISQTLKTQNDSLTEAQIDQYTDYQIGAIQEAYDKSASPTYGDMTVGEFQSIKTPELTDEQKELEKQGYPQTPGEDQMIALEDSAETISIATEENKSELEKNTAALQAATYAYSQAEGLKQKQFQDGLLGWQGASSIFSDTGGGPLSMAGGVGGILSIFNAIQGKLNRVDNGFLDNNSPILTASQSDKNYAGSTEFAGIYAADMYRSSQNKFPWESDDDAIRRGLEQFFGNDYDQIIGLMRTMDAKVSGDGYGAMRAYGRVFGSMDKDAAARAQLMLKDNKPEFQKLGKQMFRYEQQYGFDPSRTAYGDYGLLSKGIHPTATRASNLNTRNLQKNISNAIKKSKLTVTDKNLIKTVKELIKLSDNKLTESNVLALGAIQQLQDMYQVANEQVVPGINQTVSGVYDTVGMTSTAASNAGDASAGAFSASNNAAAIAAFLGAQATDTAYNKAYQAAVANGDAKDWWTGQAMSKETFIQKLNDGTLQNADKYQADVINTLRGAGLQVNHPDYTPDQLDKRTKEITGSLVKDVNDGKVKLTDAINTVLHPLTEYGAAATMAAYNKSNIGEYGSGGSGGSGGGGGGDGGGGSGDSGSNEGTKKSRVDLVLCNKKEIPKLNVNLFKTPPNFTILNKNFKLRDIKINSQDKPKAIMAAVKNGIIETQKRMDPKIIQDESGEYDPLAATEGKATPSGNTPTSSSSSNSN